MNFLWKILLGMLFWDLLDGCEEVPVEIDCDELDFEEMELE